MLATLEEMMADEDSDLYNLMLDVQNGDRSDWMTGYGEPPHQVYMCMPEKLPEYPERCAPMCWSGYEIFVG